MDNVSDLYSLSPMQKTMLLRAVTQADDDVLFNQFRYRLDGDVSEAAVEHAWQDLVTRHPALRTSFLWEDIAEPVQVVHKAVQVPFEFHDWRGFDKAKQMPRLERWLELDRAAGFDLASPPLIRVALFRLGDERFEMVWSSHHLVLDRWCLETVYAEFAALYAAVLRGRPAGLCDVVPFRSYIAWLREQDPAAAVKFWRDYLRGYRPPSLSRITNPHHQPVTEATVIDTAEFEELRAASSRLRITIGILLQASAAIALAEQTDRRDVVMGVTTAARPSDVTDVERVVGSFINTLPLRVQLEPSESVSAWLRTIQSFQQRRVPYEYLSPVEIQNAAGCTQALFDCLLVWLASAPVPNTFDFHMTAMEDSGATGSPATIFVLDCAGSLELKVTVQPGARYRAKDLISSLTRVLAFLASAAEDDTLGDVLEMPKATRGEGAANYGLMLLHDAPPAAPPAGRQGDDMESLKDFVRSTFCHILAIDDPPDDATFFALGGNSLSAAQVHARIENGVRKSIPILALFRQPSVIGMAKMLLRNDFPLRGDVLTTLRSDGRLPPLFCVASPEVNTIGYALLMHHLEAQRPVYVLQGRPDSDAVRSMTPSAIDGEAEGYVNALLATDPKDPIHLLGMCSGAHLALSMARQLVKRGRTVGFLGVVSTWAMFTVSKRVYLRRALDVIRWYSRRARELLAPPTTQQPLAVAAPAEISTGDPDTAAGLDSPWITEVGWPAADPRIPKYPGIVTVFRLKHQPQQYWRIRDHSLGWGRLAERTVVQTLPGSDHDAVMREPTVRALASTLDAGLRDGEKMND